MWGTEAGGQHFKSLIQRKVCLTAGEQRTQFPLYAGLCDASNTAAMLRDIKKTLPVYNDSTLA